MALTKVINDALGFPLALSGNRTYIATNTFMGKSAGNNSNSVPDGGTWDTEYTTHTLNGSTKYCIIQLFGGGGQGARTHNPHFGAAGGGSGAYVKFLLDVTDSNFASDNGNATTLNFILGDGVLNESGQSDGEDTKFEVSTTAIITAGGGSAGSSLTGGSGGSVSWTDKSYTYKILLLNGLTGENGFGNSSSSTDKKPGVGAPNPLGFGGSRMRGRTDGGDRDGDDSTGFGGGGGGGMRQGGGSEMEGGAGYNGAIIIEEYA